MKKTILIIFLCLLSVMLFGIDKDKGNKLFKRRVMILPFYNTNQVKKYQYISDSLRDALKTELLYTDQFILLNFGTIDSQISRLGLDAETVIKEANALDLADKLEADVVVIGTTIIIEDQIKIQIKTLDTLTRQDIALINNQGELGLDIFRIIDDSTQMMAEEMVKKLKPLSEDSYQKRMAEIKKAQQKELGRLMTPRIKTGITLTAIGGAFFLTGLPLFIYDVAGYSLVVRESMYENPRTDQGYQDYLATNQTYIALFSISLSLACLGVVLMGVGIPLFVYDVHQKKKELSLNLEYRGNFRIAFSCRY